MISPATITTASTPTQTPALKMSPMTEQLLKVVAINSKQRISIFFILGDYMMKENFMQLFCFQKTYHTTSMLNFQ